MWYREGSMEEYARKYPGCSLKEYCNYLKKVAEAESEVKRLKEEENNNLLKSFEGKCFRIDFNRSCIGYFKITKDITASREIKEDFYEVYIGDEIIKVCFAKKRFINRQWLPEQGGGQKCEIISEEIFNKIVKYYQGMCDMAEKIKDMQL